MSRVKRTQEEQLQPAPNPDSGGTKMAQLYRHLHPSRHLFPRDTFVAGILMVAMGLWVAWHECLDESECLRRAVNVSDMASRLVYHSLTSRLEDLEHENLWLKNRERELQQENEEVIKRGEERVKELQMYREGELERKEHEKQDFVTQSETLKSQLEYTRNRFANLQHREVKLQQAYDTQSDKGRQWKEELMKCQAYLKSKYDKIRGLENEMLSSQEEHNKELQAEQKQKKDELEKKDSAIRNLMQIIREKEEQIKTLSSEVEIEKGKVESKRAQYDALRSTHNDCHSWLSESDKWMLFIAGVFGVIFGVVWLEDVVQERKLSNESLKHSNETLKHSNETLKLSNETLKKRNRYLEQTLAAQVRQGRETCEVETVVHGLSSL